MGKITMILAALSRLLSASSQLVGDNSKDDLGLTGYEIGPARAALAAGDERWAARLLRRYVKTQLTSEEAEAVKSLCSQSPEIRISPDLHVSTTSRLDSRTFEKYKGFLKEVLRARYNPADYSWVISAQHLGEALRWFSENGFSVSEYPVISAEEIAVIAKKQQDLDRTVSVRFHLGQARFKSHCKSEMFNNIFNNKKGYLSGITEYIEDTYERGTCSFALAKEAIDVLSEKGFILDIKESYVSAVAEYEAKQLGYSTQDPAVTAQLSPEFSLFQHQNKAVEFLDNCGGNAIIGACMGSGKTLMTLAWAAKNNLRVCVLCPKVVRRTWINEAKKFFPKHFKNGGELDRKTKSNKNLRSYSIVSVNYEGLSKWEEEILDGNFDVLIIDESHYIKNFKAQRTASALELSKTFANKILLSGTVVKNDRYELAPQLMLVDSERFGSGCNLFSQTTGKFWHEIQSVYLAMPKNEVLAFLPEKRTIRFDQAVNDPVDLPSCIEEITLFKHLSALSKVDITIEKIKDILDNSDDNVLVFSEFKDVCQKIASHFASQSIYHDGEMSQDKREKAKESFQDPDNEQCRVFVSTRPSLAVGATLTRASHVVFNDLPWNAADIQQAEDRTHRIGQHKPVSVHWVVAENSAFDLRLIDLIGQKYRIQKAVTEGKQLSQEELDLLKKPVSILDFKR